MPAIEVTNLGDKLQVVYLPAIPARSDRITKPICWVGRRSSCFLPKAVKRTGCDAQSTKTAPVAATPAFFRCFSSPFMTRALECPDGRFNGKKRKDKKKKKRHQHLGHRRQSTSMGPPLHESTFYRWKTGFQDFSDYSADPLLLVPPGNSNARACEIIDPVL